MQYNYYQPYAYAQQSQVQRLQKMREDINDQLMQLQQQPVVPQIQQTFITPNAPSSSDIPARWVNNYDDVKSAEVYVSTIFMDRNKAKFYMKDETGNIKSFEFTEVEELDEKDLKIRELENRLRELEEVSNNGKSANEYDARAQHTSDQASTNIDATTKAE